MISGAGDDADDERPLLLRRRRVDELAGLEVLQVVVGDRGDGEDDRRDEQRERDQALIVGAAEHRLDAEHQQQRRADHDEDADAGQRTVRRTDQAGHVAADRRDEEAHEHDVDQAADDEQRHVVAKAAGGTEMSEQPRDRHEADQRDEADRADRNVLFGARQQGRLSGLANRAMPPSRRPGH